MSPTVGEIQRFEASPLTEASHPAPNFWRQVEVLVEVDRLQAERFEHSRSGANAELHVTFSGLIWLTEDKKFATVRSQGLLQLVIPRSHWVDEVVLRWGLSDVRIVEIGFPKSEAGEDFRAAYLRVEAAEKLFANGQYKQVLAELYSGFEGLAKSMSFAKPDQQFFAEVLGEFHPTKKESAKRALDNLCDFLHLGRHEAKEAPDSFVVSRSDARFALITSQAVLEYIIPRG